MKLREHARFDKKWLTLKTDEFAGFGGNGIAGSRM
jgi:hypothetical protein